MNNSINTPWKLLNGLGRMIILPFVRLQFLFHQIHFGRNWKIFGFPIIQKHRLSTMKFGDGLSLRSTPTSNPLGANHPVILCTQNEGALIQIGNDFGMTGGSICAAQQVVIGDHVNIGANSSIVDTDFHPLEAEKRLQFPQDAESAAVRIEDNVFIGMNCLILKGVTIGYSSVIGAGSVVTKDIPPNSIAAGNPARVIKELR